MNTAKVALLLLACALALAAMPLSCLVVGTGSLELPAWPRAVTLTPEQEAMRALRKRQQAELNALRDELLRAADKEPVRLRIDAAIERHRGEAAAERARWRD